MYILENFIPVIFKKRKKKKWTREKSKREKVPNPSFILHRSGSYKSDTYQQRNTGSNNITSLFQIK